MQSVQRGACPRRHPELGRKRAGLLIQGNGAGCIVFLQKQCAGQIIARLRPEVAVGSKPQLGAEIGGVAAGSPRCTAIMCSRSSTALLKCPNSALPAGSVRTSSRRYASWLRAAA